MLFFSLPSPEAIPSTNVLSKTIPRSAVLRILVLLYLSKRRTLRLGHSGGRKISAESVEYYMESLPWENFGTVPSHITNITNITSAYPTSAVAGKQLRPFKSSNSRK